MVEQLSVSPDIPNSELRSVLGSEVEFGKDLAPLTSYGTGGEAKCFIMAKSEGEIVQAVTGANKLGLPFCLIGGGSNLLVSDSGYDGLVIKVCVLFLEVKERTITIGAGEQLSALVDVATEKSLTGAEFAAGIWGTVGGAIYGNAGAFGSEIGSILTSLTLVDLSGKVMIKKPEYCEFQYRDSALKKSGDIVVSASFELESGNKKAIQSRVDEILELREEKHPSKSLTAGCFFKNIPDKSQLHGKLPAGKLLEEAGVKGLSVGGASVYEKHANIIVNTGKATSKEIRELADIMKEKVRDKFGVELQEEVIQIGKF